MTADRPEPQVSRRREVGHASARSLLMTVLGEFVLPRDHPMWTSTALSVLAMFGVEEKSARQALARTGSEGWLVAHRSGRRTRWALTDRGKALLTEGAARIYEFGQEDTAWDGRWLLVLVSVPESQRELRHRIRTQLTWAGFGSPAPGVWVSPHTNRQQQARQLLTEAGLADAAMSFAAEYGTVGNQDALVSRSWDLTALEERYARFIDEFTALAPTSDADALRVQTRLVHEWRRFPFLDPRLPAELLPPHWSGAKAAEEFHTRHAAWHAGAQRHWDTLVAGEN